MGHENWTESDGLDTIPYVEEFLRQEKLKSKIKEAHQDLIQALDPIVNTSILRSGEARTFTLLGVEGNYSKYFFKTYLVPAGWRRRAPRTKEDIPNLLMDIGYTYLFNFIDSLLRLHGFDTYKGYYHKLFFDDKANKLYYTKKF